MPQHDVQRFHPATSAVSRSAAQSGTSHAPLTFTTTTKTPLTTTPSVLPPHAPQPPLHNTSILESLPTEVMIPSLFVLLCASVSLTLTSAVFNYAAQRDRSVTETFRQWSRVLWMTRAAHIVDASSPPPPASAQLHRHMSAGQPTQFVTPPAPTVVYAVETYDNAAFFRGIAAPTAAGNGESLHLLDHGASHSHSYSEMHSRLHTPAPPPHGSGSRGLPSSAAADVRTQPEMAVYHAENPPATVPAPVVAEALTNTMEAVRLESQRLLFRFHPYYIILCSLKACAMLLYIQYHFDPIEGGWRRFCVCGAANIFSGLLTPVWEYFNTLLLPLDPDRAQPAVIKVDEEKTDSVFIVEVLLRIGSLELDDLPTVLTQGSSFVAFSAVLVPLCIAFCLPGIIRYVWVYVPLWILYVLVRHLYYRGAGALPSSTARNAAAVVGMTGEFVKAFLMKAFTLFVVLVTVQSSFLLGLAWAEKASYDAGLQYTVHHELSMHRSDVASTFQKLCLLSQLLL